MSMHMKLYFFYDVHSQPGLYNSSCNDITDHYLRNCNYLFIKTEDIFGSAVSKLTQVYNLNAVHLEEANKNITC